MATLHVPPINSPFFVDKNQSAISPAWSQWFHDVFRVTGSAIADPVLAINNSLTDGGILLGSGTGAITALGVATNGQIPIGDGTGDPVLATITGSTGITVSNGAGIITLSTNDSQINHDSLSGFVANEHIDWTSTSSSISTTGTITCDNNISIGPSTSTEGGQINLEPGTSGSDTFVIDNFSDNGRLFFSTTNNRTISVDNFGSGTVTFDINGALTKSSGSFKIKHPIDEDNKYLLYGFVESPQYDLLHRGKTKLQKGSAKINIDSYYSFLPGTFKALCRDAQVFVVNNNSWNKVRAKFINKSEFKIECEKPSSDIIDWLVIAERQDSAIKESPLTDAQGHLINEVNIPEERKQELKSMKNFTVKNKI